MTAPTRRLMLALAAFSIIAPALPTPALAAAERDASAEAFVQSEAGRALGILAAHSSVAAKTQAFRGFVDQAADVPRITNFVLGKYARSITPAQRAQFAPLFREYASNVYESRLGQYKGEQLKVTASTVRKPGDVIVASQVFGGQLDKPVNVSWRVNGGAGSWKVVDVQVAGIWLAITQQQDFVSTIDNAGGNVDVLIGQLKRQVAQQNGRK
jgi:phospholipid transport system substrate-binding protein